MFDGGGYWAQQAIQMRQQARKLRQRAEDAIDGSRSRELLALAAYCDEAATSMEQLAPPVLGTSQAA